LSLYDVVLTKDAERDLTDIYRYIAEHDSARNADHLLQRLLEATESLQRNPARGSSPKELQSLGIAEYRQLFFKPYRLIYRLHDKLVVVYLIADGRRDMQALLARRLLAS
jgi:toxin ParE1/3/4